MKPIDRRKIPKHLRYLCDVKLTALFHLFKAR